MEANNGQLWLPVAFPGLSCSEAEVAKRKDEIKEDMGITRYDEMLLDGTGAQMGSPALWERITMVMRG